MTSHPVRLVAVTVTLAVAGTLAPAMARAVGGSEPCPAASEACSVFAVTRYLDSITDPSIIPSIPLTATARRFENGLDTGARPEAIRASLMANSLLVQATDERRLVAVRTGPSTFDVIVRYLVQTKDAHPATAHVMQRFTVVGGFIDEIDAVLCIAGGAHESLLAAHFGWDLVALADDLTSLGGVDDAAVDVAELVGLAVPPAGHDPGALGTSWFELERFDL